MQAAGVGMFPQVGRALAGEQLRRREPHAVGILARGRVPTTIPRGLTHSQPRLVRLQARGAGSHALLVLLMGQTEANVVGLCAVVVGFFELLGDTCNIHCTYSISFTFFLELVRLQNC